MNTFPVDEEIDLLVFLIDGTGFEVAPLDPEIDAVGFFWFARPEKTDAERFPRQRDDRQLGRQGATTEWSGLRQVGGPRTEFERSVSPEDSPAKILQAMARDREGRSDDEILDELSDLPALADEDDACWNDAGYWHRAAYPYLALAGIVRQRRLRAGVRLLLERACFGDPGEIMRGLRHTLEAIMNPDWTTLADICMDAARSGRPGTIMWAVDQLLVLEDERARPLLKQLITYEPDRIGWLAEIAVERLDKRRTRTD